MPRTQICSLGDREESIMRVEFLTQDDPLYILPFFEEFFRHYAREFEVTQVNCCRSMGKRPRWKLLREVGWLYGTAGLARLCLRLGIGRVLGLLPRKRDASRYYSFQQLCRPYGVPCEPVENPNREEFITGLKQRRPDVLISVACPYILKEPLLSIAPRGSINIHHAPLPSYKGMMPTFWQMFHGEQTIGLTIHYMVAKVDEGDALYQDKVRIEPNESLDHLMRRCKRYGARCMAKVLRQLESGTAKPVKLDLAKGSYFTVPTREEAFAFRRRGLRAI